MSDNLWQYVMKVDPFVTKEDIIKLKELNKWDLLIVFANGRKVIYDRFNNCYQNIFYKDVNEITEEQEKKEFAYKLRGLMNRKWVTQKQLAEDIGTSQVMISRYVRGEVMPSVLIVRKIAKALNCSIDDFFYDKY